MGPGFFEGVELDIGIIEALDGLALASGSTRVGVGRKVED
jgi:hypothetical protein